MSHGYAIDRPDTERCQIQSNGSWSNQSAAFKVTRLQAGRTDKWLRTMCFCPRVFPNNRIDTLELDIGYILFVSLLQIFSTTVKAQTSIS